MAFLTPTQFLSAGMAKTIEIFFETAWPQFEFKYRFITTVWFCVQYVVPWFFAEEFEPFVKWTSDF